MTIIEYVTEEVGRQGHNTAKVDGILRVSWMLDAWVMAMNIKQLRPAIGTIAKLGQLIEPGANYQGFRTVNVRVGANTCMPWEQVQGALVSLLEHMDELSPNDFYKAFEVIHPFRDGNGRVGKILLNWLNCSLDCPVFPPHNLFGKEIANP